MLTYHLDPHAKTPLYEQLYRAVRADIMSGTLAGGERLPSKRQLAANLRISQITVETAYSQLLAEGYLVSEPRRAILCSVSSLCRPPRPRVAAAQAPQRNAPEPVCRYDFRTNIVDNGCFPFSTWARLSRSVLSEYSDRLLRATDPCGASELRAEIVRYLYDFRGINVSPDNILVGAGSEYLMHLVIQLLGRDRVRIGKPRLPQAVPDLRGERHHSAPDPAGQAGPARGCARRERRLRGLPDALTPFPARHGHARGARGSSCCAGPPPLRTGISSRMITTVSSAMPPAPSRAGRAGSRRPRGVCQHLRQKPGARPAHQLSGAAGRAHGPLPRAVLALFLHRTQL